MSSLTYSSLSESQRAQVAYLFADAIFGTDAGAFTYEVKDGNVHGRMMDRTATNGDARSTNRARRISPAKVTMLQEVNITDELKFTARTNMDALAASIASKLQQSQEEVHA
jgi:hypothetical protein